MGKPIRLESKGKRRNPGVEPQDEINELLGLGKNVKQNGAPEMPTDDAIVLKPCKREGYVDAWQRMYALDPKKWNQEMFDGVNPALNKKPLGTEVDNFCVVAFDPKIHDDNVFPEGRPIGIFSMVVTKGRGANFKPIGKQFVVDPDYQGKGVGTAMLVFLENQLMENGYDWYYIGCSKMSAGIQRKLGRMPYDEDVEGDLYRFNINLIPARQRQLVEQYVLGKFKVL